MMSRITLHLKKQMHGGRESNGFFVSTSEHAPGRVRFTRATEVNITVQQFSIMHDDHGDIIETPKSGSSVAFGKGTTRRDEWHELGPVSPVRLNINASHGSAEASPDIDKVMAV